MGTPAAIGSTLARAATGPAAGPAPAPGAKARQLDQAAQEFEGMLIAQLWKGFQNDPLTSSGNSDSDTDDSGGSMTSLGVQAMATSLSAAGGLGLAHMIERQLAPDLAPPAAPNHPASPPLNPLKMPAPAADIRLESGSITRSPARAAGSTGGRS